MQASTRSSRSYLRVLSLGILCVAGGCGWPHPPSDGAVAKAFLQEHRGAVVTSVTSEYPNMPAGRQGGDIVVKHIRFRSSSTARECEVVWIYIDGVPEWTLSQKSDPTAPGTLCDGCRITPCGAPTS